MGLDMYLTGEKRLYKDWENPENNRQEDGFRVRSINLDLGFWRKHPNLHGFIVHTFSDGEDKCQPIDLSATAMRTIIKAIGQDALPETEGFFFGKSEKTAEQRTRDTGIFTSAIAWLDNDEREHVWKSVTYQASW